MKVKGIYTFREEYLPPRCRKPRSRQTEGVVTVNIKEVSESDAPIAMITTTNEWRKVENSPHPDGKDLIPVQTIYRWHNKKLYIPFVDRFGDPQTISDIEHSIKESSYPYDVSEEERIKCVRKSARRFLVIGGIIHVKQGEPRYCINTFGLGHNNGGTGFFVENFYNCNIGNNNYFNAMEREEAIEYGKRIALGRGDTESVDYIGERCNIEVLIPEAVQCNPQQEHGDGCSFINDAESIIRSAECTVEAGFDVMALAFAGMATA